MAKFRLKLKKVGKITRPFRYNLNQIPYDLTVGVRNSFKGLDLIDRTPEELWMEVHDIAQDTGIKPTPLAIEMQSLNHWTTREVPKKKILNKCLIQYI